MEFGKIMKKEKSLLNDYIRYSVSHTFYVPSKDEFGIKDKIKEMEDNKRLEKIFEYPITPVTFSLLYRIMDDEDCDDLGYFEKDEFNVDSNTFSCFPEEFGQYRPAKKGYIIADVTVLDNKGNDIVIMQFEVKKNKIDEFCDAFRAYITLYSFEHDDTFEFENELI